MTSCAIRSPRLIMKSLFAVIDQDDLYFTTVAGIDRTGCIQYSDAHACRQGCVDAPGLPYSGFEKSPVGTFMNLPCLSTVLMGFQIEAGIADMLLVRTQICAALSHFEIYLMALFSPYCLHVVRISNVYTGS